MWMHKTLYEGLLCCSDQAARSSNGPSNHSFVHPRLRVCCRRLQEWLGPRSSSMVTAQQQQVAAQVSIRPDSRVTVTGWVPNVY